MDVFVDVQRKAARGANPAAVRQLAILRAVLEAIQEQQKVGFGATAPWFIRYFHVVNDSKGQEATVNEILVAVLSAVKRSDEPQTLADLIFLADRSAANANPGLLRREFDGISATILGALEAFQVRHRPSTRRCRAQG
eukprot:scaffold71_cov247-Pinguiococcus_pyrenoidosus.AAC.1